MGQEEDSPTNLSNHGRKGRASSPLVKYLEMGVFLSRSASDLPSFGASVSILSRRAIAPCGRRKISLRKKINFRAHKKIFSCARKFIFVRIEIFLRAHGSFSPFGRKRFSFRRALFFSSDEEQFFFGRRQTFLPRKKDFPALEKFPPSAGRFLFLRKEKYV